MGKFGETYDRLVNELAIAPALPVLQAVGGAAGRAAISRGLAALGGGLATLMSNSTKKTTKDKKTKTSEQIPTTTRQLPGVKEPVIQSKFNENYERVITELQAAPSMAMLGGRVGSAALKPSVTSTSTYTSPGPVRPSSSYSYNTPGSSTAAQTARTTAPRLASAALAGNAAINAAGAAFPIAATGAALGAAQQSMQRFGQRMTDLGVSAPRQLPPGTVGITGKAVTVPPTPTTPTSTPSQPDTQTGTLIPTPNTGTETSTDVQAQAGKDGFGKAVGAALNALTSLAPVLATAPALAQIRRTNTQTGTQTQRGGLDLIPTDQRQLPGVEEPIVQDKFYIQ